MEVQAIDFVVCQRVYLLLHELFGTEMAGDIEHHAPIFEARRILNLNRRDRETFGDVCARRALRQLQERLNAVVKPSSGSGLNLYLMRSDGQGIAFRCSTGYFRNQQ